MDVEILFTWKNKNYNGVFSSGSGAGASGYDHWHLYIDRFYYGQFCYSQTLNAWLFTSNGGWFEDLSEDFEAFLIGWFGAMEISGEKINL